MQSFKNINVPLFVANEGTTQTTTETKRVLFNKSSNFTLNGPAVQILIDAATLSFRKEKSNHISKSKALLANKLYVAGLNIRETQEATLEVERVEVINALEWMTDFMAAGEEMQDDRNEHFDADLYIASKMLMLDLKLWLCGTIIED